MGHDQCLDGVKNSIPVGKVPRCDGGSEPDLSGLQDVDVGVLGESFIGPGGHRVDERDLFRERD